MKKPTKISLAIVILMGILYFFGLHTPFIINRVKKQIKSGQSVNQVMDILNSSRKKPDPWYFEQYVQKMQQTRDLN